MIGRGTSGLAWALLVTLLTGGCDTPGPSWDQARVSPGHWQLHRVARGGPDLRAADGYTLTFSDDGRVAGVARGRAFFGVYRQDVERSLRFDTLGYTRRPAADHAHSAGQARPPQGQTEPLKPATQSSNPADAFLETLAQIDGYQLLDADRLALNAHGRRVFELRRARVPPSR